MKKNKLKNISGITLVEILIGIAVSALMVTAMFTTYNVVNNSYSQVTDRAKISRSGRDVIAMLMRDIRLAGYKFYMGTNTLGITKADNLTYHTGEDVIEESHDPIIIIHNELGYSPTGTEAPDKKIDTAKDKCCDKIHIVYGDFDHTDVEQPYKRYKITYYAKPNPKGTVTNSYYGIYRTKESWIENEANPVGQWVTDCDECYHEELLRDHLDDMEFVAFNKHGRNLFNSEENSFPRPDKANKTELYNIRIVDVRLTFRSKDEVYRPGNNTKARWVKGLGNRARAFFDRYLRDSVVVSIHTRNIGS